MTATVSLEISDYLPAGFSYDNFSFNFRTDGFEETIETSKRNCVLAQITNLKKDRKFTVRVQKNNSVVGIAEVVLPQMMLLKREENYSKLISISMIDSVKRLLLGKDWAKTLQIVVRAKIEYSEGGNYENGPRSSSAKPISSIPIDFSGGKSSSGNKRMSSGKNTNTNTGNRGSIYVVKDKNERPQVIDEYGEVELTFIDSVFNDDHIADFDGADKTLNEFIDEFNHHTKEISEESDPDVLHEQAKSIIPKLFELQKVYYSQFNSATKTNRRIKELLLKYNEKFRTIMKKTNRLREALESNQIRNDLTSFMNREEGKRNTQALNMNRTELDIFKKLFKIDYSPYDLENYKQKQNLTDVEQEKQLLLRVIENVCKNSNLLDKIPEDKRIKLNYLTAKFGIKVNANEEELNITEKVNKIDLDDIEESDHEENLPKSDNESPKKRLSLVKSNVVDEVDRKLDNYLLSLNEKKRISQIPFRRLSKGEYEFGSQKVLLKVEGETIRVRTGGGFILLDKFIEVNAPLEEAKLIVAQNVSDKYRANPGVNKVLGNEKNLYDIQTVGRNMVVQGANSKFVSPPKKKK